jgi:hypothetical protein
MRRFAAEPPTLSTLPGPAWAGLVGIAVGGSAVYGASLSLRFPRWRPDNGALWLALSAGLGWCVFGPTLVLVTRRNALTCAHACLVAALTDLLGVGPISREELGMLRRGNTADIAPFVAAFGFVPLPLEQGIRVRGE